MSDPSDWEDIVKNSKPRGYLHLDCRCSLRSPGINCYVCNPNKIARHGFFPFIHFQIEKRRIKKDQYSRVYLCDPKTRDLYYASHIDACIYQRYAFLLNQCFNQYTEKYNLDSSVIAYRNNLGKCNLDFAKEVFDFIAKTRLCYIYVTDFSSFFDNLDHRYLKHRLEDILQQNRGLSLDWYKVFRSITRFSCLEKKTLEDQLTQQGVEVGKLRSYGERIKLSKLDKSLITVNKGENGYLARGIPQGSPISAVLSNVYMSQVDRELFEKINTANGIYRRYCDDILIAIPLKHEDEFLQWQRMIGEYFRNLTEQKVVIINLDKTVQYLYQQEKVFKVTEGASRELAKLDYLGLTFDGYQVALRQKSITKYFYRMRSKAINVGRQLLKANAQTTRFPYKLYDAYSTCAKGHRYRYTKAGEQIVRRQRNFVAYVFRANAYRNNGYLNCDSMSQSIMKRNKAHVRKFINLGKVRQLKLDKLEVKSTQ